MKLRRFLYGGGAVFLLVIVFAIDLVRKNVELDIGGLSVTRDAMIIGAFALVYFLLETSLTRHQQTPIKKLGVAMIASALMILVGGGLGLTLNNGFDTKNYSLLPLDYPTQFAATFLSCAFGLFAVLVLQVLSDLVMYKRKRTTLRNFRIFLIMVIATAGSTITMKPLETSVFTNILYGTAILFALVSSFRLSWIVYLTKREKVFGLIYGFFLFIVFTLLNVLIGQNDVVNQSLLYYSFPMKQFVTLVCIFGNVYFGMAFVSTLFHLPTAEAFDRKTSEVTSLHNLSRLVTQVFDFDELVETVTSMTMQVCEAKSCWLELIHYAEDGDRVAGPPSLVPVLVGGYRIQVAARKNITQDEIDAIFAASQRTLRDTVLEERKPIVVDDVHRDERFKHLRAKGEKSPVASLVVVPLVSHAGPVGILYVTKDTEYGFFKDDVDVISAFADHATIAIENSRLINKSIERERLLREMLLAQEMQRKLLPQVLPQFDSLELHAISTPAFEVGGDYYDVLQLNDRLLGVIVGDVSGKGVSAAFYMSEVKGIFQALGRLYPSPREFMVKANEALASSIDKHSFISLIYAVVDVTSGILTLSRAGHCPMLHVSNGVGAYVRPSGMGLGLSKDSTFADTIEEHMITLRAGDVCVFYTDGVTEARRGDDEFGYERLLDVAVASWDKPAAVLKEDILGTVRAHVEHQAYDDDLTLVVLKWHGNNRSGQV
ncbi:MAG: PP2C family protein-serine/threonine phosphatase [Bacteroidota bacterium]